MVYESSNRLFDPTVQPLFMKYSGVRSEIEGNKSLTVGWDKVRHTENEIHFGEPGMAITFNGIAQGYATDVVKSLLKSRGFDQTLVNIGEFAAGKKLARIGLADDTGKVFEVQNIIDQAIATSSPGSLSFENGGTHIIRPNGGLKSASWKTVSVIAELAVLADGFSTALCLTENTDLAVDLKSRGLVQRVILQDIDNVVTII